MYRAGWRTDPYSCCLLFIESGCCLSLDSRHSFTATFIDDVLCQSSELTIWSIMVTAISKHREATTIPPTASIEFFKNSRRAIDSGISSEFASSSRPCTSPLPPEVVFISSALSFVECEDILHEHRTSHIPRCTERGQVKRLICARLASRREREI